MNQKIKPLLIVDEAQGLSDNALEELRLLTNLQHNNKPLLQIFLVGQEGLRELVLMPHLEQLHQRIVAACHLQPLNDESTKEFINFRLIKAGWNGGSPKIEDIVYHSIYRFSLGIPRWINLICSRLLLHGMVEERMTLTAADINTVTNGLIQEQLLPRELESSLSDMKNLEPDEEVMTTVIESPPLNETSITEINVAAETPKETAKKAHTKVIENINTSETMIPETEVKSEADTAPRVFSLKGLGKHKIENFIANKVFNDLAPLLFGKTTNQRCPVFLKFINGMKIDGQKLYIPEDSLENKNPTSFLVWLDSDKNPLHTEAKIFLRSLFEMIDR